MKSHKLIAVDTVDKRNLYLLSQLRQDGYNAIEFDSITNLDNPIILLLSPNSPIKYINLAKGSAIFCGKIEPDLLEELEDKSIKVFKYFDDKKLSIRNAQLTAEGALADIILNTPDSLLFSKILIIGNGKVACAMAKMLRRNTCKPDVLARNCKLEDKIRVYCNEVFSFEDDLDLKKYSAIVNTVPSLVLDSKLNCVSKNCYILDLASKPGGVNFKLALSLGLKVHHYLGIPGTITPKIAATYIKQSVLEICKREKYL